jgi:Family of unknown function (DUF6223)
MTSPRLTPETLTQPFTSTPSVSDMLNDTPRTPSTLGAITNFGSGRLGPTITAIVGLAALTLGAQALSRARRSTDRASSKGRGGRRAALVLGVAAVLLGVVFIAAADGGPGTGNGVVASGAAISFGSAAIGLDRLATSQRHCNPDSAS